MDWKYVAGFFDGEGTITKAEKRYRIYVTQTSREVLDSICQLADVGSVKPIKKRKSHWQNAWVYYITDKHKIRYFLRQVYPYLVVKKQLASKALEDIDEKITNDYRRTEIKKSRIQKITSLRAQGLSYRAIGKEMNIDWGYARKLVKGLK